MIGISIAFIAAFPSLARAYTYHMYPDDVYILYGIYIEGDVEDLYFYDYEYYKGMSFLGLGYTLIIKITFPQPPSWYEWSSEQVLMVFDYFGMGMMLMQIHTDKGIVEKRFIPGYYECDFYLQPWSKVYWITLICTDLLPAILSIDFARIVYR